MYPSNDDSWYELSDPAPSQSYDTGGTYSPSSVQFFTPQYDITPSIDVAPDVSIPSVYGGSSSLFHFDTDLMDDDSIMSKAWESVKSAADTAWSPVHGLLEVLSTVNQWKNGVLTQQPGESLVGSAMRGAKDDLTWFDVIDNERQTGGPNWVAALRHGIIGPDDGQMAEWDPRRPLRAFADFVQEPGQQPSIEQSLQAGTFGASEEGYSMSDYGSAVASGFTHPVEATQTLLHGVTGFGGDLVTDPSNYVLPVLAEKVVAPALKTAWNGIDIIKPGSGVAEEIALADDFIEASRWDSGAGRLPSQQRRGGTFYGFGDGQSSMYKDVPIEAKFNVQTSIPTPTSTEPPLVKMTWESDELQAQIDNLHDSLEKAGLSFDQQMANPELNALYDRRVAVDMQAMQFMDNTVRRIIGEQIPDIAGTYDPIIQEVYSINPSMGAYNVDAVSEALSNDIATVQKLSRKLAPMIFEREMGPVADFWATMESPFSGLTNEGKSAILNEARSRAETLHNSIKESFFASPTEYPTSPISSFESRLPKPPSIVPPAQREGGAVYTHGYIPRPQNPLHVDVYGGPTGLGTELFPQMYPTWTFGAAHENLAELLPKLSADEIAALKNAGPLAVADRLVAERAMEMGHDAIQSQHELFLLDDTLQKGMVDVLPKITATTYDTIHIPGAYDALHWSYDHVPGFHYLADAFAKVPFAPYAIKQLQQLSDFSAAKKSTQGILINEANHLFDQELVVLVKNTPGLTIERGRKLLLEMQVAKVPEVVAADAAIALAKKAPSIELQATLDLARGGDTEAVTRLTDLLKEDGIKPLDQDYIVKALELKGLQKSQRGAELAVGLDTPELIDKNLDYALYQTTPDAQKAFVKFKKEAGWGKRYNPVHASQVARNLPNDLSPEVVNAFMAEKDDLARLNILTQAGKPLEEATDFIKKWQGYSTPQFLVTDPAVLNGIRQMRGARAIADMEFINTADQMFGKAIGSEGTAGWRGLKVAESTDPRLKTLTEHLKGRVFHPEVAEHMNALVHFDAAAKYENLTYYLNKLTNLWKPLALNFKPATIMRNAIGNVWNNILGGVSDPKYYEHALDLRRGAMKAPLILNGKQYTPQYLEKLVTNFGIRGGYSTTETYEFYARYAEKGPGAFDIPGLGKWLRGHSHMNSGVEDVSRMAHFIGKLDQGYTPIEAALSTKKYLFDYATGLTQFERDILRPLFPFYTWTRFNVPLQAEMLIKNPRPFVRLADLMQLSTDRGAKQQMMAEPNRNIPPFIKEGGGFPIGRNDQGQPEVYLFGSQLPANDLQYALRPSSLAGKATQMLNPFVQWGSEMINNVDRFSGRPIKNYPGETVPIMGGEQSLFGTNVDPFIAHTMKKIPPLQWLNSALQPDYYTEQPPKTQAAIWKAVKSMFGLQTYAIDFAREDSAEWYKFQEQYRAMNTLYKNGNYRKGDQMYKMLNEQYGDLLQRQAILGGR